MPKQNRILILMLAAVVIALAACSKSECGKNSDCIPKTCQLAKCQGGKCAYVPQDNCCGNKIKESIESGKPGNSCTCPDDYGKCEGKVKIKINGREDDAVYMHNYCKDNACVAGFENSDVVPQNFLDSMATAYFKASVIEKYNRPFDINKDSFEFKVALDDAGNDLIFPVSLSSIKILYMGDYSRSELLVAEKDVGKTLNSIGDQFVVSVPLTLSYKPSQIEESGVARYTIDYSFQKQTLSGRDSKGNNIYANDTVRSTFTGPSKQIFLVRTS